MSVYLFSEINPQLSFLGAKGYNLGIMRNAGLNVPDGLVLTSEPSSQVDWDKIEKWWNRCSNPLVAVRSSAVGEDSKDFSFAGQNQTFLNSASFEEIKQNINKCFQSFYRNSSQSYRNHFLGKKATESSMNVVIQIMVDAKYSGVYFSTDPRTGEQKWIVEAVHGFGESLVSGKVTPMHFEEGKVAGSDLFEIKNVIRSGELASEIFNCAIDMEWAIDKNGEFFVLQARPITALVGIDEEKKIIRDEVERLKRTHELNTIWDGQTFAEWSGPPSELTFSLWQKAFAKGNAFSKALELLGHLGIKKEINNETHSLLEKIFGRAYVNISLLIPMYYGPMPYRLILNDTPKLKFDIKKLNFKTLLQTPKTIFRMVKVGFGLSTQRAEWIRRSSKELIQFNSELKRIGSIKKISTLGDEQLKISFQKEAREFYENALVYPLLLVILIESSTSNLKAMLKGLLSEKEISKAMNQWMANGIHSVTMEMNREYTKVLNDSSLKEHFLELYGHRGPGELELSHARWSELGDNAFINQKQVSKVNLCMTDEYSVLEEIEKFKSYKVQILKKEWLLLKELLELREEWKMSLLKRYARLRAFALEIGDRARVDNVFWFTIDELTSDHLDVQVARKRKEISMLGKNISLPNMLSLHELENHLSNSKKDFKKDKTIYGEALSPGLVYGEVRVVSGPEDAVNDEWPEDTILVAETTDPGWTGLFLKSKGIVVEKGGVLSHCAIVAREMHLPAISGINQCHLQLKNGDKVWVDGNNGRLIMA